MPPGTAFPVLALLRSLGLLGLFLAPGYGVASWLLSGERGRGLLRWGLGFACSFAVFGLLAWPFLWYRRSTDEFLQLLVPAWAGFLLLGTVAQWRAWRSPARDSVSADDQPEEDNDEPAAPSSWFIPGVAFLFLLCYLAGLGAAAIVWHREKDSQLTTLLVALPGALALGYLGARLLRDGCRPILRFTALDHGPAPWPWVVLAVGLVLAQALSSVAYDRSDWDDCFYLAAVLDYEHAEELNSQEPTHREGFPMPGIDRLLCWELGQAVLCRFSGLSPQVLCHSVLPGLLVLLSYAVYTELLAGCLPRRWVPLGIIALSAYHLWGISSHDTAANYLLPRPWQGKTVLLHIVAPLLVVLLLRYARRPSWRRWLALLACVLSGLFVSVSAIFLLTMLAACLLPALLYARVKSLTRSVSEGRECPSLTLRVGWGLVSSEFCWP